MCVAEPSLMERASQDVVETGCGSADSLFRKAPMKLSICVAALGAALLVSGPAFATDAAAPSPSPSASAAAKPDKAAMEAKSQECSKEADAKGLHGKPRKEFRAKCKKGAN